MAEFLFSAGGYAPHGYCLAWEPTLLWLHIISNALIALAYFTIPIAMFRVVSRRRDLPRRELAWLFAAFILLCGATHAVSIMTFFVPIYGFEGVLKAITAAVSTIAAVMLFRLGPELLRIPGRTQLVEANARLAAEVANRREAQEALRRTNAEIEARIAERTRLLRESEERYQLAIDGSWEGVWDWRIEDDTTIWTDRNRELLGYTREAFPDRMASWRDRIHAEDLPGVEAALHRHLEDGERFERRYRIRAADGSWHWWESRGTALRDAGGRAVRMLGINRDVTDEVARAEELSAARGANEAKSAFLARMSHELRTPMNGVIGMADLLRSSKLGEEQRIAVETIVRSGENMLEIINDVLDLSKVEAGALELASQRVDLHELIEDIGALLAPSARSKGLELVVDLDCSMRGVFLADRMRLRQIVTNLVGNAVRYTDEGHVTIGLGSGGEAVEDADAQGEEVIITVSDTGPGILPADRERIFSTFAQGGTADQREGGTGLGLAICRQLCVAMGGGIEVSSTPGEGAVFTCRLRLLPAPAEPSKDAPADVGAPMAGAGRAVVVARNPDKRLALQRLLRCWGWEVDTKAGINGLGGDPPGAVPAMVALLDETALAPEPAQALTRLGPDTAPCFILPPDSMLIEKLRVAHPCMPICGDPVRAASLRKALGRMVATSATAQAPDEGSLASVEPADRGAGAVEDEPVQMSGVFGSHAAEELSAAQATDARAEPEALPDRAAQVSGGAGMDDEPAVAEDAAAQHAGDAPPVARDRQAVVLVAEDNKINRLVIASMLEGRVGSLVFANTGREAVDLWREHRPALILMDLQMPDMDGYAATRAIRQEEAQSGHHRTPIIALTANAMADDRQQTIEAGMDDFIAKPVRQEQLIELTDRRLATHESSTAAKASVSAAGGG
ncbi:MAG: ATP-binding protein [Pseudomonadota bacterium]